MASFRETPATPKRPARERSLASHAASPARYHRGVLVDGKEPAVVRDGGHDGGPQAGDVDVERVPMRPEEELREQPQAGPPEMRAGGVVRGAVRRDVTQAGDPGAAPGVG